MKVFLWIIWLALAATVALLAIANRGPVTLSLNPLPLEISAPLYLIVMAALFGGFALGNLVGWLNGRRRTRQKTKAEIEKAAESPGTEITTGNRL